MNSHSVVRNGIGSCLLLALILNTTVIDLAAETQRWKRVLQATACGVGGVAGVKIGEKIAEIEAKRLGLSPSQAAKHKRAFQVGIALALCGGGAAVAGTTYSRLSKRGKDAREREITAALADASPTPRTYTDPDSPSLQGIVTAQPMFMEGERECRVVQDQLASDEALVKYCRSESGEWSVKTV